jgi:DNA-binding transcriptional LysR family regulator
MTLEQLRIFVAVAEREHMTRASEVLNLTQSATSAAIAALEERHDVRLFDRVGRRIVLTDAGRDFLQEAHAVLARASIATRRLDDLAGLKRGSLRLAASQTVANYWLPDVMARFHAAHPDIQLAVQIGNSIDTADAVKNLDADIGIVEGACHESALRVAEVPGDTLRLVAPRHLPALNDNPTPEVLRALPWVLREAGSGTRESLLKWLAQRELALGDLSVAFELPSNEAVCSAVEAGVGVAVMSDLVVRRSLETGHMVAIRTDLPQRAFKILTHNERHLSGVENLLIKLAAAKEMEPA